VTARKKEPALDLEDTIRAVLAKPDPDPAVVAEVEGKVREALAAAESESRTAGERALDPTIDEYAAAEHREVGTVQTHRAARLAAAATRLGAVREAAEARITEERRKAAEATATAAAEAVTAEIVERYPKLAGEIADLLGKAADATRRAQEAGVTSVETLLARAVTANGVTARPFSLFAAPHFRKHYAHAREAAGWRGVLMPGSTRRTRQSSADAGRCVPA
jgi:hypothetical protein